MFQHEPSQETECRDRNPNVDFECGKGSTLGSARDRLAAGFCQSKKELRVAPTLGHVVKLS
jgi:hypothetical protein